MKHTVTRFLTAALVAGSLSTVAQVAQKTEIDKLVVQADAEAHLRFLASDEMRGRDTGSPELARAAEYIRDQFRKYKLQPAPGTDDFYQPVELVRYPLPAAGRASVGKASFALRDDLLVLDGGPVNWKGDFVYVGYGSQEELEKQDLKGKMVLALAGSKTADNVNAAFAASRDKYAAVRKLGAAGLVEVLALPQVPWPAMVNFFFRERWTISEGETAGIPFIWLKPKDLKSLALKTQTRIRGELDISIPEPVAVPGRNVAGMIPGTDPALRDQYVVITAHYDHIGVQRQADHAADSIFNGARDNATGTVALIQTARYLSQFPARRSVILVALTSEEKGLLGSRWYVRHPLVPLAKTVLNLNCDGVGYNDKTRVTSISLGRTNMDDLLSTAAGAYGFSLGGDPDPREGFYDRSDQVSFAKEGIPALKLQPGLARMDEEIMKYYHRAADEAASIDFEYLTRFYRTFVLAVDLLANDARTARWNAGDKYEAPSKSLYGY